MNESSYSKSTQQQLSLFKCYLKQLLGRERMRLLRAFLLMLGVGVTNGIGLITLVPLLGLLGVTSEGEPSTGEGGLTAVLPEFFEMLGLPFTPGVVLSLFLLLVMLHTVAHRYTLLLVSRIQLEFVDYLRGMFYRELTYTCWSFFVRERMAEFNHILTSDIQRVGLGTHFLLRTGIVTILSLFYLGVAMTLSPVLSLAALAAVGAILILLGRQNHRVFQIGFAQSGKGKEIFNAISDHLGGMKLAKSYAAEEFHIREFEQHIAGMREVQIDFQRQNSAVAMWFKLGAALLLALVSYFALNATLIEPAELLVLVFIFARLMPMFSEFYQGVQKLQHMLPAFATLEMMRERCLAATRVVTTEIREVPSLQREIQIKNLHFAYDRPVLKGVDLIIPARETTVITGPSGGGKSTLADLLLGLLEPDQGDVFVDGCRLESALVSTWRRQIAYVPQESFLFHDTVRNNLLWAAPHASDEELWQALQTAEARAFVAELPQGLDTLVGDRGCRLSGGERQRIALARALLRQPALLILDEATSALDQESESRIHKALAELHGDLTMVVITHHSKGLLLADRVVRLEQGRIDCSG